MLAENHAAKRLPQKETEIKHNVVTVILQPVSFHNSQIVQS